ncbi:hypothetical protein QJQ45_030141 [Haematococcus lacustris]|nr:hypothetical protein QJQ45_020216 [Haematococcus lacustris]KAJ9520063.1 hypothetical protein QJQ45_030141 [Haematococcus lacustris]
MPQLARQRATMRMGSYVRVYGHLQRFDGALQLKAYNIRSITDFNEASAGHASHSTGGWEQPAPVQAAPHPSAGQCTFNGHHTHAMPQRQHGPTSLLLLVATKLLQITYHNLQVICQRLHLTQGSAAAPTAAMGGAMASKPLMAPAAAAAIPQAVGQDGLDNLHQTVLNVYTDPAFANSSNGLATHDLIQQLAARGFRFTPAQVTGAVEHLIEQGVLFTTIDDQHARAASSAVM